MTEDDIPRLSCTEQEFVDAFRKEGFLSPFIDEAVPAVVRQHAEWFAHAASLNRAGLAALYRRENEVVGLSSHHPISLATRMIWRALSAFQGAIILYQRGMAPEGDTLSRSIYEIAFWLGFIDCDPEAARRAFINDECKSQKARAKYYLEQYRDGAYQPNPDMEDQLRQRIADLDSKIIRADTVSIQDAAKRGGLYSYYDAYKHLSAGSAHNSLNSLHRYLKRNQDGSYDGHIIGPDPDSLAEALPVLCIGLGVALSMFCTIVAIDGNEAELHALLIHTDTMRKEQRDAGGGVSTIV